MPGIKVHPNESFDKACHKFKKQVDRNLIVTKVRTGRFFEPMTEIRKKQKISARKKTFKRLYMLRRYESRLRPEARKGFSLNLRFLCKVTFFKVLVLLYIY